MPRPEEAGSCAPGAIDAHELDESERRGGEWGSNTSKGGGAWSLEGDGGSWLLDPASEAIDRACPNAGEGVGPFDPKWTRQQRNDG